MKYLITAILLCFCLSGSAQYKYKFRNPDLPMDQRVDGLVSRLTIEEKIDQLLFNAPAIDRLGIPAYNWWNECLHGVARAGYAAVFPQSISIAASWNKALIYDVASSISDEARAKHHEYMRSGNHEIYQGLTFWSPNINIFRDPRWGRGYETYGEDPFLTGEMGKEFVLGLQGGDGKYLKVVATAKHFAVHSGPEPLRHSFDVNVSERDLHETYLPAFRSLVVDAKVYSVMGAYNRFRGEACCASSVLFNILRNDWGFNGYVVSDCDAIADIWRGHKIVPDMQSAAVLALKEGCDLNCGSAYQSLHDAYKSGQIKEEEIDIAVKRLFMARFKLGMFDPIDMVEYAKIPFSANNSKANNELALKAARESIVLLKNDKNTLPLSKTVKTIAVIGPNADEVQSLRGDYNGVLLKPVTLLDGIRNKMGGQAEILYSQGSDLADGIPLFRTIPSEYLQTSDVKQGAVPRPDMLKDAVETANKADVVILALGLNERLEGEEMSIDLDGFKGGDRTHLNLPKVQEVLMRAVYATGKPVVLVLINGSAISVNWASENIPAILTAGYSGQQGGNAIADVLFGDYNPAGRLPVTYYKSVDQLPPFENYDMAGRTYRYFKDIPLYPFGYGLSYSSFKYGNLTVPKQIEINKPFKVSVVVTNTGRCDGDEVVQLYLTDEEASTPRPIRQLEGFERVYLKKGESKTVTFYLNPRQLSMINKDNERVIEPGWFSISVGGQQPGFSGSQNASTTGTVTTRFEVTGEVTKVR